jgi:hypothetical protein
MLSSIQITAENILHSPLQESEVDQHYEAVRESLADIKPWMSWAHNNYSWS